MFPLRSRVTTVGRNASGARALWRATGTQEHEFGKPIVAIVNPIRARPRAFEKRWRHCG